LNVQLCRVVACGVGGGNSILPGVDRPPSRELHLSHGTHIRYPARYIYLIALRRPEAVSGECASMGFKCRSLDSRTQKLETGRIAAPMMTMTSGKTASRLRSSRWGRCAGQGCVRTLGKCKIKIAPHPAGDRPGLNHRGAGQLRIPLAMRVSRDLPRRLLTCLTERSLIMLRAWRVLRWARGCGFVERTR
jgi:hypothetical protein